MFKPDFLPNTRSQPAWQEHRKLRVSACREVDDPDLAMPVDHQLNDPVELALLPDGSCTREQALAFPAGVNLAGGFEQDETRVMLQPGRREDAMLVLQVSG